MKIVPTFKMYFFLKQSIFIVVFLFRQSQSVLWESIAAIFRQSGWCIYFFGFLDDSDKREDGNSKLIFHSVFVRPVVAAAIDNIETNSLTAVNAIEKMCLLVSESRPLLLSALRDVFEGDEIIAEWMLLHLVSSVYKRADTMPIG